MPALVSPLASGIAAAASGYAEFYQAGTTTPAYCYTIDQTTGEYQPAGVYADLDSEGSAIVYVLEQVDVVVRDSADVEQRRFRIIDRADNTIAESQSFTGNAGGYQVAGGQVDLATVLDRWLTSAGTVDFKVRRTGAAADETIVQALAAVQSANSPFYDVTTYGADPTGAADSYAAIMAAYNAAVAAGGGIIFFPPGTYLCATAISSTSSTVSWMGVSPLTSIIRTSVASGYSFVINDSETAFTGHFIRDLGFDSAGGTGGLQVVASPKTALQNLRFYNMGLNTGATPAVIDLQTPVIANGLIIDTPGGTAVNGILFESGSATSMINALHYVAVANYAAPALRIQANNLKISNYYLDASAAAGAMTAVGLINITSGTNTGLSFTGGTINRGTGDYPVIYCNQVASTLWESNNSMVQVASGYGMLRMSTAPTGTFSLGSRVNRGTTVTSNDYYPNTDIEFHYVTITNNVTIRANLAAALNLFHPGTGARLTFVIYNSTAGALNVTWNAVYDSNVTSVAAGQRARVDFAFDHTNGIWRQTGVSNY